MLLNIDKNEKRAKFDALPSPEDRAPSQRIAETMPSMEEALESVPEKIRVKLGHGWNMATTEKKDPHRRLYFNRPSQRLVNEVNMVLGEYLDIDNQFITHGHIRHINKEHGIGRETSSNQIPVTENVFTLIPHTLENFDNVEKSPRKTSDGHEVVKITKQYSDGQVVIADAILQKNSPNGTNKASLEIRSIYVKELDNGGKERASASNYSPAAPWGVYGTNPAINNKITHSGENVNS